MLEKCCLCGQERELDLETEWCLPCVAGVERLQQILAGQLYLFPW